MIKGSNPRQQEKHQYVCEAQDTYRSLNKKINKETLEKIPRCNKIIVIYEMLILETHKIGNHITEGIMEVIEAVSLDQIIRIIKITVDSNKEKINPAIIVITNY